MAWAVIFRMNGMVIDISGDRKDTQGGLICWINKNNNNEMSIELPFLNTNNNFIFITLLRIKSDVRYTVNEYVIFFVCLLGCEIIYVISAFELLITDQI